MSKFALAQAGRFDENTNWTRTTYKAPPRSYLRRSNPTDPATTFVAS